MPPLQLALCAEPEAPIDQYERESLVMGCAAHLRALINDGSLVEP